ncbi:FAD:protein FMN transferase [Schleiferilactobacillus perolens]|uniref:FAD:protein FMN transferase n=1 Tax=Schleiferilactobacillus perolens DSM 12744 TaxID=1423792 RepID=A0A0R1MLI4_9LACO|nr:FAD:protein FMN transferase [Schleiferilactobacillus perolens]KRL08861.1 thiamine biosynthesis lipoprotein [Schleiferilactobacillus perolens DSM 12744]
MTEPIMVHQVLHQMNIPFTITLAVTDATAGWQLLKKAASAIDQELVQVDDKYSPFKSYSQLRQFQRGNQRILIQDAEFQQIYAATMSAAHYTAGAFDPFFNGPFDPTGYIKGWAIERAARHYLAPLLHDDRVVAASLNGGGDMQLLAQEDGDFKWPVGIEDPRDHLSLIASYDIANGAVATSGTSKRGEHIVHQGPSDLIQVTILTHHLSDADVWATAGLAAGEEKFNQQIKDNTLNGLYVTADHRLHVFANGVIRDAQTT